RITMTGTVTGGTFKLKFDNETTANITWNATAAEVQAALEALPTVGTGNVAVTGGPGPGTPWDVEFTGALGTLDVPAISLASKALTGSGANVTFSTTTPGVLPVFNGWLSQNGNVWAYIGTHDQSTAGAVVNPVDRMVHPVDRGNQVEGYTTAGTDYPATQQLVDPSPPDPNSYLQWRGGCGRQPLSATSPKADPFGESSGEACADGSTDCSGHPWGSWGYEMNNGFGYSHTYLKTLPDGSSGLPDRVCVNFYDVHGGGNEGTSGFQKVNSASEITVDLANDTSIRTNSFNVNEGANCVTVAGSELTTVATDAQVGSAIHDTATLSGVPAGVGGTITFKAFKR
ncbi:MAG TPA: hypothetical protein VE173_02335, partial [Longimicrobiales bacterium]|nr:hypothetical protein [Longimicrobiales bacterium]